jgi:hypothetical protein
MLSEEVISSNVGGNIPSMLPPYLLLMEELWPNLIVLTVAVLRLISLLLLLLSLFSQFEGCIGENSFF